MKHENLIGFKIKSYNILKLLGQGQFAYVFEAFNEENNSTVAIKSIPVSSFSNLKIKQLAQSEIKIMKSLRENPNIVKFIDNFKSEKSVLIVMQYCEGGNLQQLLQEKIRFAEDEAIGILKQLINGFKGMHQHNVMHRDFKAANIMIKGGVYKIADLGFAKMLDSKVSLANTILGSGVTQAPEVTEGKPYGMNADIWSLGVVFYQLIYGKYPYFGPTDQAIYQLSKKLPSFDGINIQEKTKDFISRCLTFDSSKRFSWAELYDHPLINERQKIRFGSVSNDEMLKTNKNFYNKEFKIKGMLENYDFSDLQQKKGQRMQKNAIEQAKRQNQERKKLQAALQQYKNQYLNYRNNIVFLMKYLFPNACYVTKIGIPHNDYLFILCKCTYQRLKTLQLDLRQRANFLWINQYLEDFTNSPIYLQLISMLSEDADLAYWQTVEYKANFQKDEITNQQLRQELLGKAFEYQNLLTDGIEIIKKDYPRRKLIIMIEALNYLRRCEGAMRYEQFEKYMEGLDFEEAPKIIRQRQIQQLSKLY